MSDGSPGRSDTGVKITYYTGRQQAWTIFTALETNEKNEIQNDSIHTAVLIEVGNSHARVARKIHLLLHGRQCVSPIKRRNKRWVYGWQSCSLADTPAQV